MLLISHDNTHHCRARPDFADKIYSSSTLFEVLMVVIDFPVVFDVEL